MPTATTDQSLAARPHAFVAILVSMSIAFSLGLACAVPFAALAAVAALTLGRRDALLLVGLAWLANQAVGFGLLHYPWTADTLGWGLALLAVSVLATLGAGMFAARFEARGRMGVALVVFLSAFALYEGSLVVVTLALGSGTEALAPNVIAEIFILNACAFGGLVAMSRLRLPDARREPARIRSAA
jgi:hypothetical protein